MTKFLAVTAAALLMAGAAIAAPIAPNTGHMLAPDGSERSTFLKALAAVVDSDGKLIRSHAGVTVILPDGSVNGFYRVDFPKSVAGCVFTGVLGAIGSSGTVQPGYLTVAGSTETVNGVFVATYNASGTLTASSFHLLVSC